jgi:hypothetical protein
VLLCPLVAALALHAAGGCTPADDKVVAEAERRAADSDAKARQAESVAVRSGNPGAQARANQARADADAAQDEVARLRCKPSAAHGKGRLPPLGY